MREAAVRCCWSLSRMTVLVPLDGHGLHGRKAPSKIVVLRHARQLAPVLVRRDFCGRDPDRNSRLIGIPLRHIGQSLGLYVENSRSTSVKNGNLKLTFRIRRQSVPIPTTMPPNDLTSLMSPLTVSPVVTMSSTISTLGLPTKYCRNSFGSTT